MKSEHFFDLVEAIMRLDKCTAWEVVCRAAGEEPNKNKEIKERLFYCADMLRKDIDNECEWIIAESKEDV